MGLYIIRPKITYETLSAGLIATTTAPEDRERQVASLRSDRMQNPVRQEIRRYISDTPGVKQVSDHETGSVITGTTVVDMSDEEAEKMRQELPDSSVVRDQPLDLIQPLRPLTAATKSKVVAADLWHLSAIGLQNARKAGYKGNGTNVEIAELDTGVDPTHPELDNRVIGAYTFDVSQWKAGEQAPSQDTDGHGTHVAGLMCGKKVGVAPGAKLISGVMIPGGHGTLSNFLLALEWVGTAPETRRVRVVNMSAGIPGYLPEMHEVVGGLLAAGVLPVFAVGNEGRNKTRSPGNYIEPLSVGASDKTGKVAGFSSSGTLVADNHQYNVPDLVGPGVGVYSSVVGGGYEAWDGTSMATPVVSGVAALILEKFPTISITDLVEELLSTCKDLGLPADRQGNGLIQVKAAT